MKTSRTVSDLTYRFFIAPRYLSHFQHVILDLVDQEKTINLIASLDSFTNLTELTLEAEATVCAIGNDIRYASSPVIGMLQRKGTSITTLHLFNFAFMNVNSILYFSFFPNLRNLTLTGNLRMERHSATKLVNSIPHLEELTLNIQTRIPAVLLEEELTWPPLQKLSIAADDLHVGTLEFIRIFESSLLELSISTPCDGSLGMLHGGGPLRALPIESSFPLLRAISIFGSSEVGWSIFGNSTRSTFPALKKVRLSYESYEAYYGFAEEDTVLDQILKNFSIRELTYTPQNQEMFEHHRIYLKQKATSLGIRLSLGDSPEGSLPTIHFLEGQQIAMDSASYAYRRGVETWPRGSHTREEEVERIRDYLDDRITTAKLTGNLVEYQRILNLLRPIEYERLSQMD